MPAAYRLAYIASLPHSRSTLLDLILNAHSQCISVGEVFHLRSYAQCDQGVRKYGSRCGCGAQTIFDCPFWTEVDTALRRHHLSLSRIDLMSPSERVFYEHNSALFSAIAKVSGAQLIIDSSKANTRLARLVACRPSIDIALIHLLRDPRGYYHSNRRNHRITPLSAGFTYSISTMRRLWLLRKLDHVVVSYESIARRPVETLTQLTDWLGIEFEPDQLNWAAKERRNLAGNRIRMHKEGTIQIDEEWKRNLSAVQSMAVLAPSCIPYAVGIRKALGP